MAETKKKTKKAPGRDAYDDFLDGVEKPAPKKTSGKTAPAKAKASSESGKKAGTSSKSKASGGKNASTQKSASSAGKSGTSRKKSGKVEAGIVSLGPRQAMEEKKKAGTSSKSNTSPKTNTSSKTGNRATSTKSSQSTAVSRKTPRKSGSVMAVANPVADRSTRVRRMNRDEDIFLERLDQYARSKNKTGSPKPVSNEKKYSENGNKKKPSGNKKPSFRLNGWDIFFSAGIIGMLALIFLQSAQYSNFLVMKNAVDRQTFYEGTTVDGVDVSDMTLNDAMTYWQDNIESRYASRTAKLDNGNTVSAQELGYTSDYAMVLSNAWNAGRVGSLEERYEAISNRQNEPVAYTVSRVPYNDLAVDQYVRMVAQQVNKPVTEASIKSFDLSSFKFVFSDPQPGSRLDEDALKKSIKQALDAGGGDVQLVTSAVQPTTSKEAVASQYGMIASAITNASSSSSNRLQNIKLSMQYINGTCLKPGETFSFNKVVGERTKARGFKEATAYSSGEVTEQVGGGICQVSTTLFNAAVKADLNIVERHNHSLTVAYVDLGKDAAVNWGSQDLRFTNNTNDDIYICCYLTNDKRVRFGIFGKLLKNGETITVEGVTTGTIQYETEYQMSGLLLSGEQQVIQTGKNGYTAEAYKIRWDASGNQISRELLCKSRYMSKKQIIQYGP